MVSSINLPAIQWGWKAENTSLHPIMTDFDPAPEGLLNLLGGSANCQQKICVVPMFALVIRSVCLLVVVIVMEKTVRTPSLMNLLMMKNKMRYQNFF